MSLPGAEMTETKPTVLIPEPISLSGVRLLEVKCECIAPWREEAAASPEAARVHLERADAVIVRVFPITAGDIERCRRLKVIAKHGVGVDNIDCRAAARRGVVVINAPGANSNAVAEHALGLLLALARKTVAAHEAVRDGRFEPRDRFRGIEIAGKTLGIVGVGRIGSRLAAKAAALDLSVIGYDPPLDKAKYRGPVVFVDALETLMARADFVSLHVPLTAETRHMIDAAALAAARPGCLVVNTARGAVIDEAALVEALGEGTIAGAALDVFENEPVSADDPLASAPNVVLSPHVAGATHEAVETISRRVATEVLSILAGNDPQNPIPG